MKINLNLIASLILCISVKSYGQVKPKQTIKKPNIIFVLTDDFGYGDVGVFWQNQRAKNNDRSKPFAFTPNLDKMASQGAMMMNSYAAAPVCAPSRSSILSGLSQGHARVRDNQFDKDLADNYTLGNVMQLAGYATAAIGKWGLQGDIRWSSNGKEWPAHPLKRGFDYYYGYMRHVDGHEHYPKEGLYRGAKEVYENYTEVSQKLDKCYTTDLWTAAAKKWIIDHEKSKDKDQPFFMYLAYDTPHAVLELPTSPYPTGGGLTGGVQWLGKSGNMINTAIGKIDSYTYPDYANATYDNDGDKTTPEVPWPDTYKRFASSTRRIDDAMGDLFKLLADLNIDDNTLVIFSSDNGPAIEAYLPEPHVDYAANFFDSFGPFDGIKRDMLEGGQRMPVIARWPGRIAANKVVYTPSISYDWLPTFTNVAGLPAPANSDGVSMLPALTGVGKQQTGLIYSEYYIATKSPNYNEFAPINRLKRRNQMQMIRIGDLVGLRYDIKSADDDFGIFDVKNDTHQSKNLAATMPNLQKAMKDRVLQVRREDTSARRPYDKALIPPSAPSVKVSGIKWTSYTNNSPWLPQVSTLPVVSSGTCAFPDIKVVKNETNVYAFEGYIKVPEDGEYTFFLNVDGKAFFRLHEASVIDADYNYQSGSIKQTTMRLKAGFHSFKIFYSPKKGSTHTLNLQWESSKFSKTKIPSSAFFKSR